jgi:hypothetical protein
MGAEVAAATSLRGEAMFQPVKNVNDDDGSRIVQVQTLRMRK